jgi:hypothetical protein
LCVERGGEKRRAGTGFCSLLYLTHTQCPRLVYRIQWQPRQDSIDWQTLIGWLNTRGRSVGGMPHFATFPDVKRIEREKEKNLIIAFSSRFTSGWRCKSVTPSAWGISFFIFDHPMASLVPLDRCTSLIPLTIARDPTFFFLAWWNPFGR